MENLIFNVKKNGTFPSEAVFAGMQGDNNAYNIQFVIDEDYYDEILAAAGTNQLLYRFDCVDFAGNRTFGDYALLSGNTLNFALTALVTSTGSFAKIYLSIAEVNADTTVMEKYAFPANIYFENIAGIDRESALKQSLSGIAYVAKQSVQSAAQSASAATNAKTVVLAAKQQVEAAAQIAADSKTDAQSYAEISQSSSASANSSKESAASSAESAETSKEECLQALADLIAMLGTNVATLVGGKVPLNQIPATATQEIYTISDESELTELTAQRGDLAELISEVDGESTVVKTWQCLGDASIRSNWVVWGTSYAVSAGNAETSTSAGNANTICGHRIVEMTEQEYEVAVKDSNTYYLVH